MEMLLKNGVKRVLTLSYDDGFASDIRLIEMMKKYGIRGTFNLNSGLMGNWKQDPFGRTDNPRLTEDVVKDLYVPNGMEVAVHGKTHATVNEMLPMELLHEILDDRMALERMTGTLIRGMAYPFGVVDEDVTTACKACGIVYSRTVQSTHRMSFTKDWLYMPATCHHNDEQLMNLANAFLNDPRCARRAQNLYVWGHSYEFLQQDNWGRMEDFFKLVGGREDVWYATNIEIYDYVEAFRHLILSADAEKVYNPSTMPIWFSHKGQTYEVPAGAVIEVEA